MKDNNELNQEISNGVEIDASDIDNHDKKPYSKPDCEKNKSPRKKMLWTIVLVAIIALTVWAITSQDGFSFKVFWNYLKNLHPGWLIAAIAAVAATILFEALAIMTIIKSFGHRRKLSQGLMYSTSDLYFSAITPSATGGQPASAYFMMKDGISGTLSTVALLVNILMYNIAIIVICLVTFLIKPSVVFQLSTLSHVLIIVGAVCLSSLALFTLLILYKSHIIRKVGAFFIKLLHKMHIIKDVDGKLTKLDCMIKSYNGHVAHLKGKVWMMVKVLIFNILQRASLIAVTLFVFLASGGAAETAYDVWSSQCMVVLGTNILPIPGAVGVSDYLLIDSFEAIGFTEAGAMNLSLLSRTISFYLCVAICGASLIVKVISDKMKLKRLAEQQAKKENENKN